MEPSRAAPAVGWVAVAVGLTAWVNATWPLPPWATGRDAARVPESGHELRWAAVILAVLGVRVAAAHRRGATLAAVLLGGWMLADAVLARVSFVDDGWPAISAGRSLWLTNRPSREQR